MGLGQRVLGRPGLGHGAYACRELAQPPIDAAIDRCIREVSVELVAMATHGRTGLGRLVMGSVAEGLLHRLQVPFILIRPLDHLIHDESPQPAALERLAH